MRNSGFVLLAALAIGSYGASAQSVREAYNFSDLTTQGTARSMGFGNALGSVGGDFSSISVNPAGLGIYRSSEFTITPSLRINATSSEYTQVTTNDNNTHFNFNNFGLVFTNAPKGHRYDRHNWKAVSFAIGMNRVADFNENYTYQGKNSTSSATQVLESDANQNPSGVKSGNTAGALGYNAYVLNQNASGQYFSIVPFGGSVNQTSSTQVNGGIDEYTFSLGGNYKEKLMLGMTLGIPVVNYHSSTYYSETLAEGNTAANPYNFNYFNFSQAQDVTGAGINAKIGAIYKFNDIFRIGLAFHSPTYYSLSDHYIMGTSGMGNDTAAVQSFGNGTLLSNRTDYNLTTPWKGVLSATVMLNKFGFITADYEYVDYTSMRYNFNGGFDYANNVPYQQEADAVNQQIKKTYQPASNFRIGAEGKLSKYFMARLGFGYYGNAYSPYGESTAIGAYTTERIDMSAGVGFRFRHFFTDLGFVHSMYQGYEQPYAVTYNNGAGTNYVISGAPAAVPVTKIDYSMNNLALTLGVKF